jgi:hypothetical protein
MHQPIAKLVVEALSQVIILEALEVLASEPFEAPFNTIAES